MKTTLNISDDLMKEAMRLSGINEKTKLIHSALEILINEYSRKQMAALFGTDKKAFVSPRKR
ncbi:MAG TPA: type II toxin-antitoxin system VapB family antitoxin [Leptospiraceae bacterium]|nr:type II toxin-antitoxin system VapB family antitoxin [Leptospiraceae bacterium]HMY66063.1 type II toxin-antitoxin system VapB family antitoxin [Leptospiraceae bacterium]HMZ58846.1 type II toxin-antitoxin system VapB family antitoxin [Leptospiraceae bacterium]HNF14872.1 type II toxin-antitoxin system VapB family antitoxin [Leptospiraceae bacterium]HNF26008.1 type II toxin-antitoxin system VapB family antitoxin [Leptospiraceae bacterium]